MKRIVTFYRSDGSGDMLKDLDLKQLVEPLFQWFDEHARVLPWREEATPYRVWVSEIMLQQTRVEAVKPYFERFTEELPDVQALADCPEEKLLKLWEGLGYYNRVRNMQKAAIQIMENYEGMLPSDYEELLKLKGIGCYTAGAIASIAYGIPVPAVDGNVLRVIARVTADSTDIRKQSFRTKLEEMLAEVMRQGQNGEAFGDVIQMRCENPAGVFNQALMELGATVCLPNGVPRCDICPWREWCRAKKENLVSALPVRSRAKARRIEKRTVLIIRDGDKVAIRKRPETGLLAGMYELPNVEGDLNRREVLELVKKMHFAPVRIQKLADAKHIFSHVEWHMKGYAVRVEETELSGEPEEKELIFVDAAEAGERYAIPAAFAVYAKYMTIRLGSERFES